MDSNTELLNFIYQNTEKGIETINRLLEMTDNLDFTNQLKSQLKEYEYINNIVVQKIKESGNDEKEVGGIQKIAAYMAISAKTILDKSISKISEVLILGSTMGVIELIKLIKKYHECNSEFIELANNLLKIEENNIEQLKVYL